MENKKNQTYKTKETCICNICGKEKNGVSTGLCNHCGRFGKRTRELALEWWASLNEETQIDLQYQYKSPCRHPLNAVGLTGREIEEIWKNELPLEERES